MTLPVFVDLHDDRPEPDWNRLADAGVVGAYLKLGEGTSRVGGEEAPVRARRARAAGLFVGFYWFARPDLGHAPELEAFNFWDRLYAVRQDSDWRPVLDLERGLPPELRGKVGRWGADVLHSLERRGLSRVAWYSDLSQARTMPELYAWLAWLAAYGPNDGQPHPLPATPHLTAIAHQYTSRAAIAGYTGDASLFTSGRVARMLGHR